MIQQAANRATIASKKKLNVTMEKLKITILTTLLLLILNSMSVAQNLRVFMDAPGIYAITTDIEAISENLGLGADVGIGFGTHNIMLKLSGGVTATADINSEDISESIFVNPFIQSEIGLGMWRTNGQHCSRNKQSAMTLLGKGGLLYNFGSRDGDVELEIPGKSDGLDYYLGMEFGLFRLRDNFKNTEFFLDGGYLLNSEEIFAKLGFRIFLKLS